MAGPSATRQRNAPIRPRPSPSESATQFPVGERRRGNDGRMYEVQATRLGVRRWVPVSRAASATKDPAPQPAGKVVFVVDNGGVPFAVQLVHIHTGSSTGPGVARILRRRVDADGEWLGKDGDVESYVRWRDVPYERAWVGYDAGELDKAPAKGLLDRFLRRSVPWWYGGNSVLLKLKPKPKAPGGRPDRLGARYVSVGDEIYEFAAMPGDEIVAYASPMGNSGVPYPYATGRSHTYLTTEKAALPNRLLPPGAAAADPYAVLYGIRRRAGKGLPGGTGVPTETRLAGVKVLHQRLE